MREERLNGLALLHIHWNIDTDLDHAVDVFAHKKNAAIVTLLFRFLLALFNFFHHMFKFTLCLECRYRHRTN